MIALLIFAGCMLGFLATFVQSRTTTEDSIMNAAATNIVYGIIEQIKNLDYTTMLPCGVIDPGDPGNTAPYTLRVQINQNTLKWLRVVYTPYVAPTTTVVAGVTTVVAGTGSVPKGPLTTPPPSALATDTNILAIDNVIGPLPLSTASGTSSQSITVHLWIWIDEIPDTTKDVSDVKRVTLVYTYGFKSGAGTRTIRNREVFLRTNYNK